MKMLEMLKKFEQEQLELEEDGDDDDDSDELEERLKSVNLGMRRSTCCGIRLTRFR